MSLNPGEALVLKLVREFIDNPPSQDDVENDDGKEWVKVPAKELSILLLERFNVSFSEKRTRTALNGLVQKDYLLRTQRIGDHKWRGSYFYRLPADEAPTSAEQ